MKVKTSDLNGAALDWAVAKIENPEWWEDGYMDGDPLAALDMDDGEAYAPSSTWSQGGPIIEREGINLSVDYQDSALSNDMVQIGWKGNLWNNSVPGTAGFLQWAYGPTPLIAAMRCFVTSKLGNEVDVPEELT